MYAVGSMKPKSKEPGALCLRFAAKMGEGSVLEMLVKKGVQRLGPQVFPMGKPRPIRLGGVCQLRWTGEMYVCDGKGNKGRVGKEKEEQKHTHQDNHL